MKRREFVIRTGAATLATLPAFHIIKSRPKQDKLGIALVGLGNYATNQLAPALQETSNCYLAGIVTGTPSKEAVWAEKYGIAEKNIYNYGNFDEIANNPDIDAVYIVLPNSMHAEFTIRGAQAGKHVICEKPMANNYADTVKMLEASKKAGKRLMVGYRLHYEPYNLEMMRLGQKQVYGKLVSTDAAFGFPLRDKTRWRLDKKMAGGGPLMDVGIYALQGTIYTIGELPISVSAKDNTVDKEFYGDVEGTLDWSFEFRSGIKNELHSSYEQAYNYLKASAEQKDFGLTNAYFYGGLAGYVGDKPMNFERVNQQARQMDSQSKSIKTNSPSLTPGEMGSRDMFMIDRIYESMQAGGKKISLKGIPDILHKV